MPSGEVYGGVGAAWDRNQKEAVHTSTLTGFRIVLEDDVDSLGKLHFSTKGWYDWKQKDGKIAVDQLWLKGYYGDFDYQVGRQLISWGTADGFNPTNYFARLSSSACSVVIFPETHSGQARPSTMLLPGPPRQ